MGKNFFKNYSAKNVRGTKPWRSFSREIISPIESGNQLIGREIFIIQIEMKIRNYHIIKLASNASVVQIRRFGFFSIGTGLWRICLVFTGCLQFYRKPTNKTYMTPSQRKAKRQKSESQQSNSDSWAPEPGFYGTKFIACCILFGTCIISKK